MEGVVNVVFDDTVTKSDVIKDVIGNKGFSGVIFQKRTLCSRYCDAVSKMIPVADWRVVTSTFELDALSEQVGEWPAQRRVLHCFSNFVIVDEDRLALTYRKISFVDEPYAIRSEGEIAAVMFANLAQYQAFLSEIRKSRSSVLSAKDIRGHCEAEGLKNIASVENFSQCISGRMDTRYFNSLCGDEYTLVKSSGNVRKIKAEYEYYNLLPDDMRIWFVRPYGYQEAGSTASYKMERLHVTDLAVKWVHGSIQEDEFSRILAKYFHFIVTRQSRGVPGSQYDAIAQTLYVDKVRSRINELKEMASFKPLALFLQACPEIKDIDSLFGRYMKLKERIEFGKSYPLVSVIGHGDPCFSNVLYNRTAQIFKFIDPKGALTEDELWTNPYYDLAKISHSICGLYDFYNNDLFDIKVDPDLSLRASVDFDNAPYVRMFKQQIEENGYDYMTVRVYEASLFLSMLPLHIDNPRKVLGFVLNAARILKEIEDEL